MSNSIRCFVATILLASGVVAFQNPPLKPPEDVVPNRETARRIADAVLVGSYGERATANMRPLTVREAPRNPEDWEVDTRVQRPLILGGDVTVYINKHSGCIRVVLGE